MVHPARHPTVVILLLHSIMSTRGRQVWDRWHSHRPASSYPYWADGANSPRCEQTAANQAVSKPGTDDRTRIRAPTSANPDGEGLSLDICMWTENSGKKRREEEKDAQRMEYKTHQCRRARQISLKAPLRT